MNVSSIRGAIIPSVTTRGAEAKSVSSIGKKDTEDAVKVSLEKNQDPEAANPRPQGVDVGGSLKISA